MKIESAKEFIDNNGYATWYTPTSDVEGEELVGGEVVINSEDCREAMIDFAKLHVKAALEAADKSAEMNFSEKSWENIDDKDFILKAYPLTNIS